MPVDESPTFTGNIRMYCIQVKDLSHKFSEEQAILNKINLRVPCGSIYGFLGPNGAGKTTTLKILLGLLKKQEGEISVFGKNFEENRINILKKTGSLIESPSLYAHLDASENLLVWQKIYQCKLSRIKDVLEMVGLSQTGSKKTGDFSLGMKQRMGIAAALLNSPELLILDEPTNGLDPNGIIEMRSLLTEINKNFGTTILVSSHLLAEIEKLANHVGILHKGSVLYEGPLEEFISRQEKNTFVYFKTNDNAKALSLLPPGLKAESTPEKIKIHIHSKQEIIALTHLFVDNDLGVYEITGGEQDLESAFMNLINR